MRESAQKTVKRNPKVYTLIYGLIVIIAAQIRLPMFTEGFVISAGVILFALFMLLLDEFSTLQVMCISAVGVMITRAFADAGGFIGPDEIWEIGMPEFAFYVVYGVLIYILFNYCKAQGKYVITFIALIIPDFIANLVEMYIRIGADPENIRVIIPLLIVAVIRSAIILVIYLFIIHYGLPVLKLPDNNISEKEYAENISEDYSMKEAAEAAADLYSKLQKTGASPEILDRARVLMEDVERAAGRDPSHKG